MLERETLRKSMFCIGESNPVDGAGGLNPPQSSPRIDAQLVQFAPDALEEVPPAVEPSPDEAAVRLRELEQGSRMQSAFSDIPWNEYVKLIGRRPIERGSFRIDTQSQAYEAAGIVIERELIPRLPSHIQELLDSGLSSIERIRSFLRGENGRLPRHAEVLELIRTLKAMKPSDEASSFECYQNVFKAIFYTQPAIFTIDTQESVSQVANVVQGLRNKFMNDNGREPRIVELGAGDGQYARHLRQFDIDLTATDSIPSGWIDQVGLHDDVQRTPAIEVARNADIVIMKWAPPTPNGFDFDVLRELQRSRMPETALIVVHNSAPDICETQDLYPMFRRETNTHPFYLEATTGHNRLVNFPDYTLRALTRIDVMEATGVIDPYDLDKATEPRLWVISPGEKNSGSSSSGRLGQETVEGAYEWVDMIRREIRELRRDGREYTDLLEDLSRGYSRIDTNNETIRQILQDPSRRIFGINDDIFPQAHCARVLLESGQTFQDTFFEVNYPELLRRYIGEPFDTSLFLETLQSRLSFRDELPADMSILSGLRCFLYGNLERQPRQREVGELIQVIKELVNSTSRRDFNSRIEMAGMFHYLFGEYYEEPYLFRENFLPEICQYLRKSCRQEVQLNIEPAVLEPISVRPPDLEAQVSDTTSEIVDTNFFDYRGGAMDRAFNALTPELTWRAGVSGSAFNTLIMAAGHGSTRLFEYAMGREATTFEQHATGLAPIFLSIGATCLINRTSPIPHLLHLPGGMIALAPLGLAVSYMERVYGIDERSYLGLGLNWVGTGILATVASHTVFSLGGIAFSSAGLGMSMAGLGVGIGSGILWGGALALGTYIGHQLDERYGISDWLAGV